MTLPALWIAGLAGVGFGIEPGLAAAQPGGIVIHEIMYHPASEDDRDEFIELHNPGPDPVRLDGWRFSRGINFAFNAGTEIGPGGFLVVAADIDRFNENHSGVANVTGPWDATLTRLSNSGETVRIVDAFGSTVDDVSYSDQGDWALRRRGPEDRGHTGWIWSAAHDGAGRSLELIRPELPNEYGQNWTASETIGGTPGRRNSVAASDTAPMILAVRHAPAIPSEFDPIVVTATLIDRPEDSPTAVLNYRVARAPSTPAQTPVPWRSVPMTEHPWTLDTQTPGRVVGGIIPAHPQGTVIEFHVEATDGTHIRTWPGATDDQGTHGANCLFQVDTEGDAGTAPVYRLVMSPAENAEFLAIDRWSGAQMNATWIGSTRAGRIVRYLTGVRIRGNSSRERPVASLRVNLSRDRPWRGRSELNLNSQFPWVQAAASRVVRASGMIAAEAVPVRVLLNGINHAHEASRQFGHYVHVDPLDAEFLDRELPADANGNLYQKRKPDRKWAYRSGSAAQYIDDGWTKVTNESRNDWSDLDGWLAVINKAGARGVVTEFRSHLDGAAVRIASAGHGLDSGDEVQISGSSDAGGYDGHHAVTVLDSDHFYIETEYVDPASLPDPDPDSGVGSVPEWAWVFHGHTNYLDQVAEVVQLGQWIRWFAVMTIMPSNETNLSNGVDDDYSIYSGSFDPRMTLVPHDLDTIMGQGDSQITPVYPVFPAIDPVAKRQVIPQLVPFFEEPAIRASYFAALLELARTAFAPERLDPMLDNHLTGIVPGYMAAKLKVFAAARNEFLLSEIPESQVAPTAQVTGEPPSITIRQDATLHVSGAGITQYRFRLDEGEYGTEHPVDQPIQLENLAPGVHEVRVIGRNADGVWQHPRWASRSLSWTVDDNDSPLRISEVLAINVSAVNYRGEYPDYIELMNLGTEPIDLSGVTLTDNADTPDRFGFPDGTVIAPGSFLTVYSGAADGTAFRLGFGLSGGGEGVYLFGSSGADRVLLDSVQFGFQIPDRSIGRDGDLHWSLCEPTPGQPNQSIQTAGPENVLINEWLAAGSHPYPDDFIELRNSAELPADLGGCSLSDNPVAKPFKHTLPPLSFVDGNGYRVLWADGATGAGSDHLGFRLSAFSGMIALADRRLNPVDSVQYGPQTTGISEGRNDADGAVANRWRSFALPTPGAANQDPDPTELAQIRGLRVTEIMFDPDGGSDFEYVELLNVSASTLDLAGAAFTDGIVYQFGAKAGSLEPGEYLILASNRQSFETQYPNGPPVFGEYSGGLKNDGERLLLSTASGIPILDIDYVGAWNGGTPGASIEIIDPNSNPAGWNRADAWRPSAGQDGSPGVYGRAENVDTDGDGTPDAWEVTHRFNPQLWDSFRDSDRDGESNLKEFLTGTDPGDGRSLFQLKRLRADDGIVLTWSSVVGRKYRVLFRDHPEDGEWKVLARPNHPDEPMIIVALGDETSVTDTETSPSGERFYRIELVR